MLSVDILFKSVSFNKRILTQQIILTATTEKIKDENEI